MSRGVIPPGAQAQGPIAGSVSVMGTGMLGFALSAVIPIALAADTLCIAVKEIVDNAIMLLVPGAMEAGVDGLLFWGALSFALVIAGAGALPVNRWLIARGKGHGLNRAAHAGWMTSIRAGTRAISAAALAGSVLYGCGFGDDGPRVTESRSVAAFSRVTNHDAVDLRLRVGGPQRVRVRAGANVIDDVRTEVRGGTLHVTFELDGFRDRDVVLEASVPRLAGVAAAGSGDIAAWGITSDEFELDSDGSGDVDLAGMTRRLSVRTQGSGDAHLTELSARKAVVVTDGSGDVAVRVRERLDVRLDGSGDVQYFGEPQLSQLDDGSGEIERRG